MAASAEKLRAALAAAAEPIDPGWPECQHVLLVETAARAIVVLGGGEAELQCRRVAMFLGPTSPHAAEFYTQLADLIHDTTEAPAPHAEASTTPESSASRGVNP